MDRRYQIRPIAFIGVLVALGVSGCEAVDGLRNSIFGDRNAVSSPYSPPVKPKPEARRPPSFPPLAPTDLIGLNQKQVTDLLGPATRTRDVAPAVVWEYRVAECALDVFFYLDFNSQNFHALAYDMKGGDGKANAAGDGALVVCLRHIRERSGGKKG